MELTDLHQWSPTFLAAGTSFLEDHFSMFWGIVSGWFKCIVFSRLGAAANVFQACRKNRCNGLSWASSLTPSLPLASFFLLTWPRSPLQKEGTKLAAAASSTACQCHIAAVDIGAETLVANTCTFRCLNKCCPVPDYAPASACSTLQCFRSAAFSPPHFIFLPLPTSFSRSESGWRRRGRWDKKVDRNGCSSSSHSLKLLLHQASTMDQPWTSISSSDLALGGFYIFLPRPLPRYVVWTNSLPFVKAVPFSLVFVFNV